MTKKLDAHETMNLYISTEMHAHLKWLAEQAGMKKGIFVRGILQEYLDKQESWKMRTKKIDSSAIDAFLYGKKS